MKLCKHLESILETELALGNTEKEKNEFGWDKIELDILLKNSFHIADFSKRIMLPTSVTKWQSKDPHYSANGEEGYICNACGHVIRAPL